MKMPSPKQYFFQGVRRRVRKAKTGPLGGPYRGVKAASGFGGSQARFSHLGANDIAGCFSEEINHLSHFRSPTGLGVPVLVSKTGTWLLKTRISSRILSEVVRQNWTGC